MVRRSTDLLIPDGSDAYRQFVDVLRAQIQCIDNAAILSLQRDIRRLETD